MTEAVDVVHGVEWKPDWRTLAGPVHLVNSDSESVLRACLEELGLEVFTIEGRQVHDEQSMFEQVAAVFGFPDYFGKNWDAFNECFGEFCDARTGPLAIIWRDMDATLDNALKTALESVVMFSSSYLVRDIREESPVQIELFWLGTASRGFIWSPLHVRRGFSKRQSHLGS
jgi:RNAse (barnase) inhibitor barstar